MTRKRWLWIFLALPVAAFVAWLVYEQIAIWATPYPHWVRVAPENKIYGTCGGVYNTQGVVAGNEVSVSEKRARRIAQRVFARQKGPFTFVSSTMGWGPYLTAATLPDGQPRRVWVVVRVIEVERMWMFGVTSTVLIDATTGDPLMLITGARVSDPGMVCFDMGLYLWLFVRSLPVYAFIGYLVLVGVVAVVIRLWRWLRRGKRARPTGL